MVQNVAPGSGALVQSHVMPLDLHFYQLMVPVAFRLLNWICLFQNAVNWILITKWKGWGHFTKMGAGLNWISFEASNWTQVSIKKMWCEIDWAFSRETSIGIMMNWLLGGGAEKVVGVEWVNEGETGVGVKNENIFIKSSNKHPKGRSKLWFRRSVSPSVSHKIFCKSI